MADANELYMKGNSAFVEDDYESAVEYYTKSIELDDAQSDFYKNRAHAYLKLKKYPEVKVDADNALALKEHQAKILLWKGIACFNLEEYEEAQDAFFEGQKLDEEDNSFATWLDQCSEKISQLKVSAANHETVDALPEKVDVEVVNPLLAVPPKIRHDWYQTDIYVNITILIKNTTKDKVRVTSTSDSLNCKIQIDDDEDYELDIRLAHEVDPGYCKSKITTSKVEIQLKKTSGLQWTKLEALPGDATLKQFNPVHSASDTIATMYPSSSAKKKDWDKIVTSIKKDEEKDGADGEGAVNELFQKIYSEGSDEVKKAMNKSFVESGGTVLSTNWGDVSRKKIDVKAPDGLEWKKWEA